MPKVISALHEKVCECAGSTIDENCYQLITCKMANVIAEGVILAGNGSNRFQSTAIFDLQNDFKKLVVLDGKTGKKKLAIETIQLYLLIPALHWPSQDGSIMTSRMGTATTSSKIQTNHTLNASQYHTTQNSQQQIRTRGVKRVHDHDSEVRIKCQVVFALTIQFYR